MEILLSNLLERQDLSSFRLIDKSCAAAFTKYRGHLRRRLKNSGRHLDVDNLRFSMLERHRGDMEDAEAARKLFLQDVHAVEKEAHAARRKSVVQALSEYFGKTRLTVYLNKLLDIVETSEDHWIWIRALSLESIRCHLRDNSSAEEIAAIPFPNWGLQVDLSELYTAVCELRADSGDEGFEVYFKACFNTMLQQGLGLEWANALITSLLDNSELEDDIRMGDRMAWYGMRMLQDRGFIDREFHMWALGLANILETRLDMHTDDEESVREEYATLCESTFSIFLKHRGKHDNSTKVWLQKASSPGFSPTDQLFAQERIVEIVLHQTENTPAAYFLVEARLSMFHEWKDFVEESRFVTAILDVLGVYPHSDDPSQWWIRRLRSKLGQHDGCDL